MCQPLPALRVLLKRPFYVQQPPVVDLSEVKPGRCAEDGLTVDSFCAQPHKVGCGPAVFVFPSLTDQLVAPVASAWLLGFEGAQVGVYLCCRCVTEVAVLQKLPHPPHNLIHETHLRRGTVRC